MPRVDVELGGRSYPVLVDEGIIGQASSWSPFLGCGLIVIVSNEVVAPLYLQRVESALGGRPFRHLVLPDGEATKDVSAWSRVIDFLVAEQAGRDACLIALGGGVIGDLCGFAAATYMRGIRFIQAPTTLLAQVDASVGGKTGVNHPRGKNLIGAFHQPAAVLADTACLRTLPEREFRAGLAEVVKYGAICDASLLTYLEQHTEALLRVEPEATSRVVLESVRHKADIVARDEFESGVRAILNFGHSFAHALETLTAYRRYLHGEAVAIGMIVAARLSEQRGLCPPGMAERLASLEDALGLPVRIPDDLSTREVLECMLLDKKNLAGRRRLILLRGPGEAVVDEASTDAEIAAAIDACR